MLSDTKQLAL